MSIFNRPSDEEESADEENGDGAENGQQAGNNAENGGSQPTNGANGRAGDETLAARAREEGTNGGGNGFTGGNGQPVDVGADQEAEAPEEGDDLDENQEPADADQGEDLEDDQPGMPVAVEAEPVEDEVPEEPEDLPTASVGGSQLATFTANFGGFSFKIIPQSTQSGLTWALWVFADNVQGPLFQTKSPISKDEAGEFGIPPALRERMNEGLRFAQEQLTLPSELRSELREKSLEDLEALMNQEKSPVDKL